MRMAPPARVTGLSIRPAGSSSPLAVDTLRLVTNSGADGDRHADVLSPRQLLLAGADAYAAYALAPQALRENLLFDAGVAGLASGTVLQVGSQALVRFMFVCEACGQLDRHGVRLAARIGAQRGMLARVLRGGDVHVGDAVHMLDASLAPWPEDWRERIARVLDAAPIGSVVSYAQLARLAGIQTSYCRAFPSLLRKLGPRYAAKAVTARADPAAPRWDGAGLFDPAPFDAAGLTPANAAS
jgi:MOSC domain-containing protein YiiM